MKCPREDEPAVRLDIQDQGEEPGWEERSPRGAWESTRGQTPWSMKMGTDPEVLILRGYCASRNRGRESPCKRMHDRDDHLDPCGNTPSGLGC